MRDFSLKFQRILEIYKDSQTREWLRHGCGCDSLTNSCIHGCDMVVVAFSQINGCGMSVVITLALDLDNSLLNVIVNNS